MTKDDKLIFENYKDSLEQEPKVGDIVMINNKVNDFLQGHLAKINKIIIRDEDGVIIYRVIVLRNFDDNITNWSLNRDWFTILPKFNDKEDLPTALDLLDI